MISILLADNHGVFRTGLAEVLSTVPSFRIVAQCRDRETLSKALPALLPNTVLFASSLRANPIEIMQEISSIGGRGIAILNRNESVQPYLGARVHGIIYRTFTTGMLLEHVRNVADRGVMKQQAAPRFGDELLAAKICDRLTLRQMRIVGFIAKGCKNREMALLLGTSEHTIKNELTAIFDKVGVLDRLELAVFIINHPALSDAAAALPSDVGGR